MARWLLVWIRNRVLAVLAFGGVMGSCALLVWIVMRYVDGKPGAILAGLSSGVLLFWIARHPVPTRIAERMADEERQLDPRPRI